MRKILLIPLILGFILIGGGFMLQNVLADSTVVVTGDTTNTYNDAGGWWFNRDTSTDTPFEFNGAEASIGNGALYVMPIDGGSPSDKFIGEHFLLTEIDGVNEISYDFLIGSGGVEADKVHFYMNVYANFGESDPEKFYDCRYDVVPTAGSIAGFTTVSFDPTETYPVTTRGSSPYVCPGSPADMDSLSDGSTIRMIALNVGDTSANDAGLDGYLDNVVVDANGEVTTYDFEADNDGDGVIEGDICEGTISDYDADDFDPESQEDLKPNRWAWNGESWQQGTNKKAGNNKEFGIEDTLGCSCDQILDELEERTGLSFNGHRKFGCSQSVLEDWIAGWYPLDSIMVDPHNDVSEFPEPTPTNVELQDGENYKFVASGVWERINSFLFDAQYSDKGSGWGENGDPDNGDLRINDVGNLWGALDDITHTYEYMHSQVGDGFAEFYVWMNDVTKYPDNVGPPLTVDILLELH